MEYFEYFEEDVKTEMDDKSVDEPFCDICQKQFRSKSLLNKHIKDVHKEIKHPCTQFPCPHSLLKFALLIFPCIVIHNNQKLMVS